LIYKGIKFNKKACIYRAGSKTNNETKHGTRQPCQSVANIL